MKNKKLIIAASVIVTLYCSGEAAAIIADPATNDCLAQADAAKILGQPVVLTEHSTEGKDNIVRNTCTFAATTEDTKTGKTGKLYYLAEKYSTAEAAHKTFADITASNARAQGQSMISNLGNEAWFHSDNQNFQLIIFRKGPNLIRLKVNKTTSFTSVDELKNVAKQVASSLAE